MQLLQEVVKLNADSSVHGMIVQVPLDCVTDIDTDLVLDTISPHKDVDGCVSYGIVFSSFLMHSLVKNKK